MQALSYTISPVLGQTLKEIERARDATLLRLLPQTKEHKLRWEAHIERIFYSFFLAHTPVNRKDINYVLSYNPKGKIVKVADEIHKYKYAYNTMAYEWFASNKPIMPPAMSALYRDVTGEKIPVSEKTFMEMLVFLQTSQESPLIKAFISYLQFISVVPASDASGKVARLLPYIFLLKEGYDFRGLLVLEKYFYTNERLLRELEQVIQRKESITPWLEHFINDVAQHVVEIEKRILEEQGVSMAGAFWELTERQKQLLTFFDNPGMRITNKKVQDTFKISQITASRDLARLANLGFLLQQGKGRSVYYVKV